MYIRLLCPIVLLCVSVAAIAAGSPRPVPPATTASVPEAVPEPEHDWKYFGTIKDKGGGTDFFYLANSIKPLEQGHLQVWVKQLSDKTVTKISDQLEEKHKDLFEQTAQKIAHYYHPPYGDLHNFGVKDAMWVTELEVIADSESIKPTFQQLTELDCAGEQYRFLTLVRTKPAGDNSIWNGQSAWNHVVPETPIEDLANLLCPK